MVKRGRHEEGSVMKKYLIAGSLTPNSDCKLESNFLGYQTRTSRDVGMLRHITIGAFLAYEYCSLHILSRSVNASFFVLENWKLLLDP